MNRSHKPIDEDEYKKHQAFLTLDKIIDFYKSLSFSIFGTLPLGLGGALGFESYFFSSIQGTIESIKSTLKNGRINDSYILLRKYHDSLIIHIYSNLYLSDNFSLENFVVKKIDDWVKGKEKLPRYGTMLKYIKESKKLEKINKLLYKEENYYEKIRKRCNNHTHYNFYYYALLNDNEIYLENRIKALNTFMNDLEQIFILHISYLFFMNDLYMMSSDYKDYMDIGITPPEDCQYYVAPFAQEVFNDFIKNKKPNLANLIKKETEMQLQ
ncbi:hypothetical protein KAR28_01980 [Candidatus Parcubacteria bacterium]|nr:hypothetical protein [Candidatus Parcubacteria bacterium]